MKASGYLVVEPTFRGREVVGCKLVKLTQGRPSVAKAPGLLVHLEVDIPASAFAPIRARLDVPEGGVEVIIRTIEPEKGDDTA